MNYKLSTKIIILILSLLSLTILFCSDGDTNREEEITINVLSIKPITGKTN